MRNPTAGAWGLGRETLEDFSGWEQLTLQVKLNMGSKAIGVVMEARARSRGEK